MVRNKIFIVACLVALIGFLAPPSIVRLVVISNSNGAILAIGGLIAELGSWLIFFLGVWLHKTKRIKNKLG